jgi:activator of 2-hydroxyglutaryl-CoA dehydratase/predicted nucleotide-binding protein (sugar kinase/HSP70/actin superfamily)
MKTIKNQELYVGFDIGSEAVHYAVLDNKKNILYSPNPINHLAKPIDSLKEAWSDVTNRFGIENIKNTAFTGSGAQSFPELMNGVTYDFDSVTIPKGAKILDPKTESVFHIGAKDAYFFGLSDVKGYTIIQQANPSSKCGGGSGTLVAKQCRRLLESEIDNNETDIFNEAHSRAKQSQNPSQFLARCGIVIQSDLIHKQNEGVSKTDNLAGLFQTVANNYIIDVLGNKGLSGNHPIATGGVMENPLIIKRLEEMLNIKINKPEYFTNVGAIGVAYKGLEENNDFVFELEQLDKITEYGREKRRFAPKLTLENVNEKSEILEDKIKTGTKVVLGIDGGSTTTKGALVDLETGNLLDKLYISTHGDPVGSLKEVIKYLSRHKEDVEIKGVATTGSARQLYQRILVDQSKSKELSKKEINIVDKVTDEITCHALGIRHHDKEVEIIYEIGGQDMKYTEFNKDGTVKEAKMNFSCQAGGGQTLENMANIIGLDVESTLQEYAFKAEKIPMIDSTCGVFMEMDLNRLISEGFSKEELAAAIVYGTAESYINKFVGGSSKTGNKKSSAQGGPALGKAFLAALAQASGDTINGYPHREMFGAWGAALDVRNKILELEKENKEYESVFRGWGITKINFDKEKTTCKEYCNELGKKNCGVRDCSLENYLIGDDVIITGGFCPVGNSEVMKKPKKNYLDEFHKILESNFQKIGILFNDLEKGEKETMGIRRCTSTVGEKGIWSGALLNYLEFTPVLTPKSNHEIARFGVDNSRPEFCIARKLAAGHAMIIKDNPNIKYSFNPSFIHHLQKNANPLKYCVYTESEGFLLNDDLSLDKNLMINPLIEFGDKDSLIDNFYSEFNRIGKKISRRKIGEAIEFANEKELNFKKEIFETGDKFLKKVKGQMAYVGIGRDYVILDPEASSNSGEMFSKTRGLDYIPQTFLMHKFKDISITNLAPDEYWHESIDILKAQKAVAKNKNLYAIRMTNFGCGPDSVKLKQEKMIQDKAGKPMLELSTDGHTSNAQFVTRTEAHERVTEKHNQK